MDAPFSNLGLLFYLLFYIFCLLITADLFLTLLYSCFGFSSFLSSYGFGFFLVDNGLTLETSLVVFFDSLSYFDIGESNRRFCLAATESSTIILSGFISDSSVFSCLS